MTNWELPAWAREVECAVVERHPHVWAFDWENPPGYICAVDGCPAFSHACTMCEAPSATPFCSEVCASEFDAEHRDPDPLACPGCGGGCQVACR